MDESRSESETKRDSQTGRLLGAGAMTALSLAYPFAALWYFWHDWIKFAREATRVWIGAPGVAVPVNEAMITWLSPWRVVLAALTAKLLFASARKLRKGEESAKALSFLTLFGVLLPQSIWGFEFVNDWQAGQGLSSVAAIMLAATTIPALLMAKGKGAIASWGGLDSAHRARVMGSAVGLGWLAMAAMSLVDHSFQLRGGGGAFWGAVATMLLATVSMAGLYRQKAWALLTSIGTVGAAGASAVALSDTTILETGTAMDTALATVAGAPVLSAGIPALILLALLRPFFAGMAKAIAGTDKTPSAASTPTRVRIASDERVSETEAFEQPTASTTGARNAQ